MQNRQFPEMEEDDRLKEYLDRCAFINKDGETCEFTTLQKQDVYKRQQICKRQQHPRPATLPTCFKAF